MKKKKLAITAVLTTSLTASSVLGSLPAVYALENTNVVQNNVEKNIEEDTLLTDIKDVSSSDLSGECGNTVNWKLTPIGNTDEYTLTISGTGTMKDYSSSSSDDFWPADKKAKITKIVIEEGVTKLGKFAFLGLSNVTSVDIAESVTSFSQGTFQSCKNLAGTINLNANFEDFSTEVFVDTKISKFTVDPNNKNYTVKNDILYSKDGKTIINCPPAKSATFSTEWLNGVSEIAPYAFRTCTQLKGTLEIPSNIVKIGKQAFQNCSGLAAENFVIPETVKEIDLKYTFANCKLTGTVTIPSHLTEIQDGAFNGCKIDGINWNGAKIKKIGSSIFTNNTNLKQINLPNTVTYIGNSTFSGCTNLTSIGTVELTYIGNSAFLGCTALENIGAVEQITYIGDTAFSGCTALGDIIKVDNIIHFGNNIFGNDNSKYTSKEINLTLENVEYIGENAFKGCTLKNDIIISEGATVEIGAFNDTTLEGGVTYLAKKIPNSLFKGKTLTHLIIGEKVENIETSVFNIATLPETVIIPETVTSYGEHMLQSVKGTKNLFLLGTPTLMPTAICYGGTYKNIVLGQDPADYKGQIGSDNKEIHDAFAHLPNGSCIYVPTSGEFLQITKKDTAIAVMNGGTIPTDTKFVEGKLATPVKKGYVFDGWYTKDGSNEGWGAKVEGNLEANKTYYAKWEKAIASVEGVGYTDLQTAIDNAEGKTVTIEKDNITKGNIELSKALEINNKKDITIDFNGVKLSKKASSKAADNTNCLIKIINSTGIKIEDANFDLSNGVDVAILVDGTNNNTSNVTLDGTVNATRKSSTGTEEKAPVVKMVGANSEVTIKENATVNGTSSPSNGTANKDIIVDTASGASVSNIHNDNNSSGGGNYYPSKPSKPIYTHEKIEGLNRYETAAKIADELGSYDNVVLVNATSSMSDGLAASGLAGKENGAILLTKKDSIPKVTMDRIKKVKKVYIIGGESAISVKVANEITAAGVKVERLGGKTRVETSELVAKKLGNYNKAFVVNGFKGEADAMSVSSVAAKNGAPILLTNGKTSTHAKKSGVEYYVIGGNNVVDKSIATKYDAEVLAGKDRYATNKEVIDEFYSGRNKIYFANGETLVDALTASTLAKKDGIALVNAKSDKSVLKGKDTVQVGGMKFTIDFDK